MSCKEVFKSKLGLKNHQTRRSRPGCWRAGVVRARSEWMKARNIHKNSWKGKQLFLGGHVSVFQRRRSGKPYCAEVKQAYLNCYQTLCNEGMEISQVGTQVPWWLLKATKGLKYFFCLKKKSCKINPGLPNLVLHF